MTGSVTLSAETIPFDAEAAKYRDMLRNLQGNIITSHGRDFAMHTFFRLKGDPSAAKATIRELHASGFITSAAEQANQAALQGTKQEVFGTLLLTARGLRTLGFALPPGFGSSKKPPGPASDVEFTKPMRDVSNASELADHPEEWEPPYRQDIDGLLIVAFGRHGGNEQATVDALFAHAQTARDILEKSAEVLAVETGHSHVIGGEPREHFGFVDGISQPLFRAKDVTAAGNVQGYDQSNGLVNLLVVDPFAPANEKDAFASFFVFRKLEQNVKRWREAVVSTAALFGIDPALAGALAMGRFQNGDPVVQFPQPLGQAPQPTPFNDFNYAQDVQGARCPYHAHIRKTNPRGDTDRSFGEGDGSLTQGERDRRIARRGISYGSRAHDLSDAPESGVGLLFMCYQANIADQFAFIQKNWVNNDEFGRAVPSPGQDAVIGQGTHKAEQTWPTAWDGTSTKTIPDFGKFVINRGGEYFIALSIPTLTA